jgi:hypothetical protein
LNECITKFAGPSTGSPQYCDFSSLGFDEFLLARFFFLFFLRHPEKEKREKKKKMKEKEADQTNEGRKSKEGTTEKRIPQKAEKNASIIMVIT